MPSSKEVEAGQAVFSKKVLAIYDWLVHFVFNHYFWKCPTQKIWDLYNKHVSANHLDAGVGTGYFLDSCHFPSAHPRLALLDLNLNCLEFSAKRLARFQPEVYQRSLFDPIVLPAAKFDSIGINYLLHCLPGDLKSKSIVFKNLKPLLNTGGVLFGATLLQQGVRLSPSARFFMKFYNKKKIFSNAADSREDLEQELRKHFKKVTVEVCGCVALFSAI